MSTHTATSLANGRVEMELSDKSARLPKGRVLLRSFTDYAGAQELVDKLSDRGFPVEQTAIMARGLSLLEQVTGRRTWVTVLGRGFSSGVFLGMLLAGFLGFFVLMHPVAWLNLVVWSMVVAGLLNALLSLLGYWAMGGRRDFDSVAGMTAEQYDVVVDQDASAAAESLLTQEKSASD